MSVPLPVVEGAYYAIIHGTNNGLPNGTTLAFGQFPSAATGAADVAVAQDIGDAIANAWVGWASDVLVDDYDAPSVSVYPLFTPLSPATISISTATGGQTGPPANMSTAALIKHSVYRRGRGSQSRTFLSHFKQDWIDSDGEALGTTPRGTIQASWNTFIAAVPTLAATAGSAGVFFGQLSRKDPGHLYPVIGSTVEVALSTQRSRSTRA